MILKNKKTILQIYNRLINITKVFIIGPIVHYLFLRLGFAKKYKILDINCSAIGHFCLDMECFLREHSINEYKFYGILLASRNRVSNRILSKLWKENPSIILFENPIACFFMDYLRTCIDTNFDCSKYSAIHGMPAEVFKVGSSYKDPLISWNGDLLIQAEALFSEIFPEIGKSKVVILHSRDSLYDQATLNHNFITQKHRNNSINSFSLILDYLKQEGYSVIRIGKYIKESADSNYLELIDLSPSENELINVYLASICSLFLGSASGPMGLAQIWRRPVFAINVLPYASLRLATPNSMSMPKLLSINKRILSVGEIFEKNFHLLREDWQYEKNGVEILFNDPLDLLEDFKEFFSAYVNGNQEILNSLVNSEQQVRYRALCPPNLYDHYSGALIPRHFFERHSLIQ